jgi:hypothetical protein
MRRALSRRHDILFLYYCDPEPDETVYCHWRGGSLARALHASLGRWMVAVGEAEPREEAYFFTDRQVTGALRSLDGHEDPVRVKAEDRLIGAVRGPTRSLRA